MKGLFAALAAPAAAFPFVTSSLDSLGPIDAADLAARAAAETNCGPVPCGTFDAKEQYVDITKGSGHAFVAPTPSDRRGPCPGLNAAANHGFIPHSGVLNTAQTVTGLAQAYGMGADIAAGLAVVAILLEGDPVAGTWSIGGPYPGALDALGEQPQGISFSHNNYEGDSSVTRVDAYLNKGDAHSLNIDKFTTFYNSATSFTLSTLRAGLKKGQQNSIATNPNYFSAQFSGLLVVPAAHNFIINFFSNHSAAQPNGYLNRAMIKDFFGVTGEPGSFATKQGHERIPPNWYRRPSSNQYDLTKALADVTMGYAMDPSTFKFGGNADGVNTFAGVDVGDVSGGAFNAATLFQGNNLGCFIIQAQQQNFPDSLKGIEGTPAPILNLIAKYYVPWLNKLKCPKLEKYNQGLFNRFPGYKYKPSAPPGS